MEDRYITIHEMLRTIISKLGLRDVSDLPIHDIIPWIGDALRLIGGYQSLETTTKTINVVNYQGMYPQDLYNIIRVEGHPNFKSIRNGFILSVTDVEVTIEYERFPVDEDGMPKLPNDVSTKEAIVWYVAMFLSIQDLLPNKRLGPDYCDRQWQWYCGQARAEGFTPTIDQWNRMVNVFYRLIPNKDEYENNFTGLTERENLFLDKLNDNQY